MKQVKFRSVLLLLLIVLLGLGLALFCLRYTFRGEAWASFSANGHAYTDGVVRTGQVLDRNGTVLYDGPSGVYHEDSALRQATLHAVGDQLGNISTSALEAFQSRLIGFDPLTGTLSGGHKVYLTIDADLSRTAWEALDGRKGVAAVYNYQTGDILCMVSNPSFDPADPPEISDDDSDYEGVYLNRLLSGLYTPGSVFKVVTTAAALEQLPGVEERTFTCNGSVTIGDQVITCPYAHGEMDLSDAFARSCNGVYAQLAVELGADVLQDYARQAGLLEGFSVSGIPTVSGLFTAGSGGDLGWSGVGQYEDMVNPCAMLALTDVGFAAAVAEKLAQLDPEAYGPAWETLSAIPAKEKRAAVFTAETRQTLRDMMAHNVQETYGQSRFGDLAVCAKSGTAEVSDGAPHAWFVGFVDDSALPLAFVVVVEHGGSGSVFSRPRIRSTLEQAQS